MNNFFKPYIMLPSPINVLGINVHPLQKTQLHHILTIGIEQNAKLLILHVNVHGLNLAYASHWLQTFLNKANVVFCDGVGVMLAAKLLGHCIPERITYAEWMWQLAELAESHGFTLFFLGGKPGIAEKAVLQLWAKFPKLQVLGYQHGYFDKKVNSVENVAVLHTINTLRPNILVVAFGMPLQEQWLMENWINLDVNIALTGGAVLDYVSGELRRAPHWMTNYGLEWLGRLLIEPRRLWRRYIIGNSLFLWRVLRQYWNVRGQNAK